MVRFSIFFLLPLHRNEIVGVSFCCGDYFKNELIRTVKRIFKSKLHCIWLIDQKFGNVAVNATPSNENDMFI